MKQRILIIDENPENYSAAVNILKSAERDIFFLDDLDDSLSMLDSEPCDLVVVSDNLDHSFSETILNMRSEKERDFIVIVLSEDANEQIQKSRLASGAAEYYLTREYTDALYNSITFHLERKELQQDKEQLENQLAEQFSFSNLVGDSAPMQRIYSMIRKIAPTDSNVVLQGESGTGKELVARAIHYNSLRKGKQFVAINCAAIPSELMESEFFGHIKGAFTDASKDRKGIFETANGGTILLDEINEIHYDLQSKLLRAVQEREVRPVGSARPVEIDIRIISSTNKNLEKEVEKKHFREDLFYRLNTIVIEIPPLRKRKEDIPQLARHFLEIYSSRVGKHIDSFSEDAERLLENYDWPGNVRELENAIERAVILTNGNVLDKTNFTVFGRGEPDFSASYPEKFFEQEYINARKEVSDNFAREYFERILAENDWNITHAAQQAGIQRQSLHEIINRLRLSKN